jgi:hypothetical protein
MRAIIIGLTFLLISAVYMLEVSMAQAHTLTIHEITFVDQDNQVIHKDYFATGADLSTYVLPPAPARDGYTFVGWSYVLPEEMPNADLIIQAQYVRIVTLQVNLT